MVLKCKRGWSERAHKLKALIIGFPLVLLCGVIHPAAMVISLGFLILVYRSYRDDVILRADAEGEDMALDMLKLPDEYTIFKQVNIPIKQVKGVVWHLSNHLKNKNAKSWIQDIVLFTNPEALLSISGETSVPVFQSTDILD
ncbi:MAG: hypothetical protein LWX55_02255 [Deltaproteobacteria bacterium]|nr:hypothetical protein [Deltaproteobacteria bacterium]